MQSNKVVSRVAAAFAIVLLLVGFYHSISSRSHEPNSTANLRTATVSEKSAQPFDAPLPSIDVSPLRVPEDVAWFIPGVEGWLCDYAYVNSPNDSTVLKILPRNTGLGKIMVFSRSRAIDGKDIHPAFLASFRYGENFYRRVRQHSSNNKRQFIGDWIVVAVDYMWNLDRMFAISAKFGDSTAMVRLATSFTIGQEIPLKKADSMELSEDRFPGFTGTDEVVHAYK